METVKLESICGDVKINTKFIKQEDKQFHWSVILEYQGRKLTTGFRCGLGWVIKSKFGGMDKPKSPTAADVLYCLCSDARCSEGTFEDFCGDLGYDTDSRKALDTYLACQAEGRKVRQLLGTDFEKFANAEH